MIKPASLIFILIFIFIVAASACNRTSIDPETISHLPPRSNPIIILATTTSTQDSGILDYLIPIFENTTDYQVKPIAVGSGQALQMGREGNTDVLLVHAPADEIAFMNEGYGSERYLVMHNDFILVGPPDDPAGISEKNDAVNAFKRISQTRSLFLSRGDDSGTHKKELEIWSLAGVTPRGEWYEETGQGMGATLRIASQKKAYTITDRATYLTTKSQLELDILLEEDKSLLNIYHVIIVNSKKWPKVNQEGAQAFAEFLISPDTQALIGQFGIEEYGEPLFFPDANKTDADLGGF